jgi:hypothetical protein
MSHSNTIENISPPSSSTSPSSLLIQEGASPTLNPPKSADLKAKVHHVHVEFEVEDELNPETQQLLNDAVFELGTPPSFGDFIVNDYQSGYRNDGVYMWDGVNVVDLDFADDEYGSLPKKFRVWEEHPELGFVIPPRYWSFISHNLITRFDHTPHMERMVVKYDTNLFGRGIYALYATWDDVHFIVYDFSTTDLEVVDLTVPFDTDFLEREKAIFIGYLERNELIFEYDVDCYEYVCDDRIIYLPIQSDDYEFVCDDRVIRLDD